MSRYRWLHPMAWWLWAGGLAVAAAQTTNPLLLALLGLAICYVVAARRTTLVVSRAYRCCSWAAFGIVVLCLLVQLGFADDPTSRAGLVAAFSFGARIGVVILCIGAAATLASPLRLVAAVRPLLAVRYLCTSVTQVQRARRLRAVGFGRAPRTLPTAFAEARARGRIAAAALEARGYGAPARVSHRWGVAEIALAAAGGAAAACFALTSAAALTPSPWSVQAPTIPALAALGVLCAVLPAHLTPAPPEGRRALRTKAAG